MTDAARDNARPVNPDTGARNESSVDLPVIKLDLPASPDQPVVKPDAKVDQPVAKTEGLKLDQPIVKVDSKKDGPIVKLDGQLKPDVPLVPMNNKCNAPKALTLAGSPAKVVEQGSTSGMGNELSAVNCSGNLPDPMDGPQLYYRVNLLAGRKYKAVLTSSFDPALYAFPAATACTGVAINTACKSPGGDDIYNSDNIGSAVSETVRIAPTANGDWIITVDSWSTNAYGSFTLTIAELVPSTNGTCATAKVLSFTAGKATEAGDTSDASNEFTNTIKCGGSTAFAGPQLYYQLNVATGKGMKVTLKPSGFPSYVYIFPVSASCAAAAIETACASGGTTGILHGPISSSAESFLFVPNAAGDYILVVDTAGAGTSGPFDLTVEELTAPTNGKCATPQAVILTTSPVAFTGDTGLASNQFGSTIECGSGFGYDGPQLYYKVSLLAGKTYTFDLTPSATWDPAIYAFTDTTCNTFAITTQCGVMGMLADDGLTGDPEQLKITPTTTADYIITVDSWDTAKAGVFTLKITWQ